MTKVKTNAIMIMVYVLILGCNTRIQNNYEMSLNQWMDNTFSFIETDCKIDLSITVKSNNTAKNHVSSKLTARQKLIPIIESSKIDLGNKFIIWEKYSNRGMVFHVVSESRNVYEINLKDKQDLLVINDSEMNLNFYSKEVSKGETNCFSNYSSVPSQIQIFSEFSVSEKLFDTYRIVLRE